MASTGQEALLLTKPASWTGKGGALQGTISLYSSKLIWQPRSTSDTPVTIQLTNITRTQKAKGKPLVRLVTAAGAHLFTFNSLPDLDDFIDIATQFEQKAKKQQSIDKTLDAIPSPELRRAIFNDDEALRDVYQNLVEQELLSEVEFWATRRQLVDQYKRSASQKAGTLSAMITEALERSAGDGTGNVSLTITPEQVKALFLEKPHVHRAYLTNVPHNMDESQFWTRYIRHCGSMRLKRNRLAEGKVAAARDIDDEFGEMFAVRRDPAEELRLAKRARVVNPAVNLAADAADGAYEGFGQLHDGRQERPAHPKAPPISAEIIAKVNRHAEVIVDGSAAAVRAVRPEDLSQAVEDHLRGQQRLGRGAGQVEGRVLDDLQAEKLQPREELQIKDSSRYFEQSGGGQEAPTAGAAGAGVGLDGGKATGWQGVLDQLQAMDPERLHNPPIVPRKAFKVLIENGPRPNTGVPDLDAHGRPTQHPADVLSASLLRERFRPITLAVYELLRHLYGSLPVTSAAHAARANKLHVALEQQRDQVDISIKSADDDRRPYVRQVLRPALEALDAGLSRYDIEIKKWHRQQQGGAAAGGGGGRQAVAAAVRAVR